MRVPLALVLAIAIPVSGAAADPPTGVLAASAGEVVVLAEPSGAWTEIFATGEVGWLFPAPGGVLFAPDLVAGRTTVIDLRSREVAERIDGVTMPRFVGDASDRYVVTAGDLLVVSYPDRALLSRVEAELERPWQAVATPEGRFVLVLERSPDGSGVEELVAVDVVTREVVSRRALPGDVRAMELIQGLGLLALVGGDSVTLVSPSTLAPAVLLPVDGHPRDVAILDEGRVAVVTAVEDAGAVVVFRLKPKKRELKVRQSAWVGLPAPPVRAASSPDGRYVAVGLESAQLVVVDPDREELVAVHDLPGSPRDVVWCDPARPGPVLPDWSDQKPRQLEIEPER